MTAAARIALLSFFTFFILSITNAQVNNRDSLALVDLYKSTGGNKWTSHTNWLTTAPVSTWQGITVEKGRVTKIYLAQNNLRGILPPSFGNLDSLGSLYLSQNNLQGGLPASFAKLVHLGTWILSDNPNLAIKFTSAIANLVSLQTIRLANTGTKGTLPKEIGLLTQLSYVDISNCALTGTLPASIGRLSQLQTLNLTGNNMSGMLPASAVNLSKLVYLNLGDNHFSGPLPSSGNLPQLQTLMLNNNEFSGAFPGWFSKANSLYTINIAHNQFTGQIPDELQNITNFYSFTVSYNHFSGPVPAWVFNKFFLFDIFLDHNDFSQPDNPCIQLGQTTDYLDLSYNHYTFNGLECINADNFFYVIAPQALLPVHAYKTGLAVSAGGTLSNNTYKWYKLGTTGSRTIVGDSSFTPPQSGSYYASITNASVPNLTLTTDTFAYVKPAAVQSVNLFVYPNPALNTIRISGLANSVNTKITIADLTGKIWIEKTGYQQPAVQLDVSRLKPGSYLLTVTDSNGIRTKSLIKE